MSDPNRKAAAAELREFLAQMRGKSPKEMLGAIASSNLAQSTMVATAAISAAIVVFTVLPFGVNKVFAKAATPSSVTAPAQADNTALETPDEPSLDPDADAKGNAASKLGIGESETAPANVNPLESSTDDLLDGLE